MVKNAWYILNHSTRQEILRYDAESDIRYRSIFSRCLTKGGVVITGVPAGRSDATIAHKL